MIKVGALEFPRTDANRSLAAVAGRPAALAAIGLAIVWLFNWGAYLHRFTQGISAYIFLFGVQFVLYLLACYAVLRRGKTHAAPQSCRERKEQIARVATLAIIVVFAGIFRGQVAGKPPYLSTDVYRYIWDGRVQANGINPYRYMPTAPELARLRDDKIFPKINGADYAPTPYPPVAQMIYLAVYVIRPLSVTAFKIAMSMFDLITVIATMLVLIRLRMDPARVVVYAWHPLVIWEGIHSGHVDPAFIAFLALALLAWVYKKDALTGAAIGLATLVKLYPVMLLPVFFVSRKDEVAGDTQVANLTHSEPEGGPQTKRLYVGLEGESSEGTQTDSFARQTATRSMSYGGYRGHVRSVGSVLMSRSALHMILGFVATIAICYLPYLGAGKALVGNLPEYFQEEGFVQGGGRYFLLALIRKVVPMPTGLYGLLALLILGCAAMWWLMRSKRDAMDVARGAIWIIGLYLLITSPRYPWYFSWLVPWLCFLPRTGWLYLTGATILLYTLWFIPNEFPNLPLWLGSALYIPTVLMLAVAHWRCRRRAGLRLSPIASAQL